MFETLLGALLALVAGAPVDAPDLGHAQEIQHIAFIDTPLGKDPSHWDVHVAKVDEPRVVRVTDDRSMDGDPDWSPDGTRVVFSRVVGPGINARQPNHEIFVADLERRSLTRLTHDARIDQDPTWSRDGTRIAFTRYFGSFPAREEIFVMDARGGNETRLTYSGAYESGDPAWSPDATQIAFVSTRNRADTGTDIYVTNSDGSKPRLLVAGRSSEEEPAWSPDGTRIAFVRKNLSGSSSILVADAVSGEVTYLTRPPAVAGGPAWAPDGNSIALLGSPTPDGPDGLYVTAPVPGAAWTLVSRYGGVPTWAP